MPILSPIPPPASEIAQLRTIALHRLLDFDRVEVKKLVLACQEVGFFYLDIAGSGGGKMLANLDCANAIMRDWFAQSLESKMNTETVSRSHGYKPVGKHAGVDGNRDGWEALKIGRSELAGRWALPPVVQQNLHLFTELQDQCHFATKVLLDRISSGLGIKGANSLHGHHRDDIPSKSSIFFLHYPPVEETGSQGGQNLHTDLGSLTFLYAQQWGLQVLCPDGNEPGPDAKEKLQWKFVAPRPGHAIINVGDTLRFLTGFRLRSALHRALQLDTGDRYAMTYFLRPNDEVELTDSEGKDCTAVDWYLKKNSNYESKNEAQRSEVMLGGMKVDV